jgi:hypothetical protein
MFVEANMVPPGEARWQAFADLEAAVREEWPWIFLMHQRDYFYTSERISGLTSHPGFLLTLESASIEE